MQKDKENNTMVGFKKKQLKSNLSITKNITNKTRNSSKY